MPAPTAAQIRSRVNNNYSTLAPALTSSLKNALDSILPAIPGLKGKNVTQISQAIARSASGDILKSLGRIDNAGDISRVIASEAAKNIEVNESVNPHLEEINLEKISRELGRHAEEIAKQNFEALEQHAALENIANTLDLASANDHQKDLIEAEATDFAKEAHPADAEETSKSLEKHTSEITDAYNHAFQNQAALLANGPPPKLDQVRKAKEDAYNLAYAAVEANLQQTSKYKEHLRDFSQNVMPMLGYKPLSAKEAEELGAGTAEPNLTSFTKKNKFSATGVSLAMATSPRVQTEAFYSLLAHNKEQFASDFKEVSSQVKQFRERGTPLSHDDRKAYVDARKRYAVLLNARNFAQNNPGKVETYTDTFQAMEAGYRANWASRRARATLNALSGRIPSVPQPTMSSQARDIFMSKRFFGGLAFKNNNFKFGSAKAVTNIAKGANPEVAVARAAAGPAIDIAKKFVAANVAGLFGLGMYFMALGKAVFTGFMIGAAAGGTVGAIAGGIIGFNIGLALAPFTFGLSVPVCTVLGIAVGGAAGAFLGGVAGGFIAYGLHAGGATALSSGVGVGVGGTVGGVAGGIAGGALVGAIPVVGPILAPVGILIGATVGAYVGAAVGGYLGYLYGKYAIGTLGAQTTGALTGAAIGTLILPGVGTVIGAAIGWVISGGWVTVKNFFAGAFTGTTATTGGILASITGAAAAVWGGISGVGGAILGGIANVGGALWGGLSGMGISATGAAAPVIGAVGAVASLGLIGGTITSATFFNPDPESSQFAGEENEFYSISKVASPLSIENAELTANPRPEITFTITLQAKDSNLNNISFTDNLIVTGENVEEAIVVDKDGSGFSSPDQPCDGVPGGQLLANSTWTCEITITTQTNWTDALVSNVVSVQATPEGESSPTQASATATVLIGEPSVVCDVFDIQGIWTPVEVAHINKTCADLGRSATISQLIATGGSMVTLERLSEGSLPDACGVAQSANLIQIDCNLSTEDFAKYVVSHELGHIIAARNTAVYNSYLSSGVYEAEKLVPTYPIAPGDITWNIPQSESFAEMIADYFVSKQHNFLARSWHNDGWQNYPGGPWVNPGAGYTTFENDWPRHYDWAGENIFGGVVY